MAARTKFLMVISFSVLMAMSSPGCAQFDFDLRRDIPWRIGEVVPPKTPTKMVAIWTDAVLHVTGKPPTRGFGGRLMFYGPDESAPIKVDGTLIVYAFDEEGRSPTDVKPDRKYVFPPDQFAQHYSKSKLGHSYSVWIPWDEVGGPRKEISLIARFIPKNGAAIVSGQSRQILPGLPPAEDPAYSAMSSGGPAGAGQTISSNRSEATPASGMAPSTQQPTPHISSPGQTARQFGQPSQSIPEAPDVLRLAPAGGESTAINPLRATNYEETSAAPTSSVLQNQTPQPSTRMRTATIAVPSPLIRASNGSSSGYGVPSYRGSIGSPSTRGQPAETPTTPAQRMETEKLSNGQWVPIPGSQSFAGGTHPHWANGSYPTNAVGTPVSDSAQSPAQSGRYPTSRPLIRSGPLGPQAPAGAIGPQARGRVGLPPLP
ncbi:MAG: hypothetical protein NZ602_05105 [Thermoguttaceae bacterium]|nr:hypothetical protein [Thermoguttaceae bacterium]MDW8039056.1 hypothetical protein [Thermoguttaceae bacterium]